jgi:hypothetical protein
MTDGRDVVLPDLRLERREVVGLVGRRGRGVAKAGEEESGCRGEGRCLLGRGVAWGRGASGLREVMVLELSISGLSIIFFVENT